jgi:hypothetical protein
MRHEACPKEVATVFVTLLLRFLKPALNHACLHFCYAFCLHLYYAFCYALAILHYAYATYLDIPIDRSYTLPSSTEPALK